MEFPLQVLNTGGTFTKADYHMHTHYSDGESSIEEYVAQAEALGLDEIAITDHVWRRTEWVPDYVADVREVAESTDLTVHVGLEAKVIDYDGHVDVTATDSDRVDFVMGVVHRYQPEEASPDDDLCNFDPAEAASRERGLTLALLDNDTVNVVGHPTRTYYKFFYGDKTEADYPVAALRDILAAAKDQQTPLEYNARLPPRIREKLLDLYVEHGVPFTLGSDSHQSGKLPNLDYSRIRRAIR